MGMSKAFLIDETNKKEKQIIKALWLDYDKSFESVLYEWAFKIDTFATLPTWVLSLNN